MGQFLRVRLQRRHVLVLRQVKHLDGAGIRRADFLVLVLFLICAVFPTLNQSQTNVNIYSLNDQIRKSLIHIQLTVLYLLCKDLQIEVCTARSADHPEELSVCKRADW